MTQTVGLRPDWRGWVWVRRGLLLLMVAFMGWAAWGTHSRGEQFAEEPLWLIVLAGLIMVIAWSRRPSTWSLVFIGVFIALELASPVKYYGAAWFGAYAVCVDANSRRPAWLGLTVSTTLLVLQVVLDDESLSDAISSAVYLLILTLLGQFIRFVFAASRAESRATALAAALQRAQLHQEVHDSAGARLAQTLVLARELQQRPQVPDDVRRELGTLIDISSAGATELRAVINPGRDVRAVALHDALEQEWVRSVLTLRSAGFDVAESVSAFPDVSPPLRDEAIRVVRESTANICKHAAPHRRVAMTMTCDQDTLALSWLNDRDDSASSQAEPENDGGLGLRGMRQRVKDLGGSMSILETGEHFGLHVTFPIGEATHV